MVRGRPAAAAVVLSRRRKGLRRSREGDYLLYASHHRLPSLRPSGSAHACVHAQGGTVCLCRRGVNIRRSELANEEEDDPGVPPTGAAVS